jgi:ribosomal protein L11 methylase PrmA
MTPHQDNCRVDVAVKVPRDIAGIVSSVLSRFVPSVMWRCEKPRSGPCLLKTSLMLDDHVDVILSYIDKALLQVEAQHLASEPLTVELQAADGNEPDGIRQRQLQPRRVSTRLAVGSPCHHVEESCDYAVILIDPREAFGDGYHPSTRIALRLVDELLTGRVDPMPDVKEWALDAGCGTGVLALAAAALGAFNVLAVDLDPRAVEATRANLKLNPGTGSNVFLALGEISCARGPFRLVMANLVPTLHRRLHETLWKGVASGGWLVLSGFCRTHKDGILRPYIRHGAAEKACSVDHAWAGTLLQKP